MIHYHGLPITPATAAARVLAGRHAFVSFADARQLALVLDVCQTFAIDNGAFSAWRSGAPIKDWQPYYEWVRAIRRMPAFDFAVIPDVIDGSEQDNDNLVCDWYAQFGVGDGVPVWHMHESIDRFVRLCTSWPRVALGSSGEFATVGTPAWWTRMAEALNAVCDPDGLPPCKLHGLRMLNPEVFSRLPLASADSTNVAQNIGIDSAWRGTYVPPDKDWRAMVIAARIESNNGATRWHHQPTQESLL